jgi:hypothetical protein
VNVKGDKCGIVAKLECDVRMETGYLRNTSKRSSKLAEPAKDKRGPSL